MNNKEKIAREFSKIVTEWLGIETMLKVIEKNKSYIGTNYEGCDATHNYCDSNMAILEAFENVMGREPVFPMEEKDAECEKDTELMNEAWELARTNNYWLKEGL